MTRISMDALTAFGVELLTRRGVSAEDARYMAELAVKTEACGVTTHGLMMFFHLDGAIGTRIDPKAVPRMVREKGATAVIDAAGAFGQLAMRLATQVALEKARAQGVAMVGVRHATWLGALNVYLMPIAEQGFLAQLWAQTSGCKDCAPVGGVEATFSTNPVAVAFPAADVPVVADISTASLSMGRTRQMIRAGIKAEAPIFMDSEGNPTNDPSVMDRGGSILFLGGATQGHKGFALSLWSEALTVLSGGSANNPDSPSHQNFTLTVIDREAFAGTDYYDREMRRFLTRVRSSKLRPGVDAIRLPGERSYETLNASQNHGVALQEDVISRLRALAEKNGFAAGF